MTGTMTSADDRPEEWSAGDDDDGSVALQHHSSLRIEVPLPTYAHNHDEDFANWPQMKVLELGGNSITRVANGSFKGLSQLWFLSLPGNDIQDLPEGVFRTLPELLHLDLSGNEIGNLRENIFDGNPKLEMLLLNGNPLTWIAPTAFGPLRNLRLLDLTNCGPLPVLKVPGAQSLILDNIGLKYLEIVDSAIKLQARNNQLTNIRLADKSSVTELDLQNNSLTTYDIPDLLMGMWRLQRLDLSRNLIHKYPAAGSDNSSELFLLPNLMFVNLSANFLQRLHYDSPFPWTRLTHLDLSYNRIFSLPATAINDAFNLQSLHLEGNYLSYFSPNTFKKSHPALKEVALYDNKFKPEVYENITKFLRGIEVNVLEKPQHDLPIEKTQDDLSKNSIEKNEPVYPSNETLKEAIGNLTLPSKKELEVCSFAGSVKADIDQNWSMWNILMAVLLIASLVLNGILIVQHYRLRGRHLIPQDSPLSSLETTFISDFFPDDPILH
ncbi:leucine-rich repeat-containing protein 15 [Drosophila takahashii]|uniref:leucine-rich repeat-containing protein 15 n=1 Tax=Drosophila takahashii TaxID=29030 RepID=UPI0038990F25